MSNEELNPDCGRIQNELPALLYGELAPEAQLAVEAHLAGCGACSEELAALRETRALLARWETPANDEDPRVVARSIARLARTPVAAPRAGRLLRWSARLAGAAAALFFALALLHTRASLAGGRLELSFALPGLASAPAGAPAATLEEMHAVAAQEIALREANLKQSQEERLQDSSRKTLEDIHEELLRLSQAVDLAREQDRRAFEERLASLGQAAERADIETRQAVSSLASIITPASYPRR